jgi:hypothetical protein
MVRLKNSYQALSHHFREGIYFNRSISGGPTHEKFGSHSGNPVLFMHNVM